MNDIFIDKQTIEKQISIAGTVNGMLGNGKRYAHIMTFGCQQNEADSEQLYGILKLMGYEPTEDKETADIILVNTCAIREHAELKALSKTGQLKKLKEQKPSMLIGVCGCMAEEEHRRNKLSDSYPAVDFVFGTDRIYQLPEIVYNALNSRKRRIYVSDLPHNDFGIIAEGMPVQRKYTHKAYVSIMYGCNNFCSYCVVPYVRGRERSRETAAVLGDVKALVESGCKDITLLGQNVNSYKGDLDFPGLLEKAVSFDGDYWVRFMTSHPKDVSKELVRVIAESDKAAKHFHLPFQAGSDRVLKAMNRKYTIEEYEEKALYIKETIKDVSLTTDVICGFPTETEEEFLRTCETVKRVGFDMMFTFLYSPRENTLAAKMDGQIPHEEKVRRFELISQIQNDNAEKYNARFVGRTVKVLCDGAANGRFTGRISQNKIVEFYSEKTEETIKGTFVNVKIDSAAAYSLSGKEVISTEEKND